AKLHLAPAPEQTATMQHASCASREGNDAPRRQQQQL
ncbi:hypothetical protein A2U01_0088448, partial [Trifolium medium]|nr:hypothetical protein [Trifolium medium]